MILVFCDTDKEPYIQFENLKKKINSFHGKDYAADKVVIFGNPCTMQIIIKHWADEILKSPSKDINAKYIQEYTGVERYKAKEVQIEKMMTCITKDNYRDMYKRVSQLPTDYKVRGSSNFAKLLEWMSSEGDEWIRVINSYLE